MSHTLFTVDLDYWTNRTVPLHELNEAVGFITNLMKRVPHTHIIKYHDGIVEFNLVPDKTQKVINIDYHNDITVDADEDLNEGTWGNFLPKSVAKFEWRYPSKRECILNHQGICSPSSRRKKDYPLDYKVTQGINDLPVDDINGLVICLSPNWDHSNTLTELVAMLGICPIHEAETYIHSIRSFRSMKRG